MLLYAIHRWGWTMYRMYPDWVLIKLYLAVVGPKRWLELAWGVYVAGAIFAVLALFRRDRRKSLAILALVLNAAAAWWILKDLDGFLSLSLRRARE
jgi:hypothetical protein